MVAGPARRRPAGRARLELICRRAWWRDPASPEIVERLFQNASDIGATIAADAGPGHAAEVDELLRAHAVSLVRLVQSTKERDAAKRREATRDLYANARDLAAILANHEDTRSDEDVAAVLAAYFDLTIAEVSAREGRQWRLDVDTYDRLERHVRRAADRGLW